MKFRWILFLLLIAGGTAFGLRYLPKNAKGQTGAPSGPKAVPVVTVKVGKQDVPIWISGLGTVQAFNTVTIRPRVAGALEKVMFNEGQNVNQGDILARIDPRPYQSTLAQAEAKQAQSSAQLANARQEYNRIKQLVGSGAESRTRFEQLEANVAQFVAQEQADKATVEAAKLDLDFTTVRAPIAGRTGVRLIDEGNLVTSSQTAGLVVITQLQPISVVLMLPQNNLSALRKRMLADKTPLTVQSLTDDGNVLAEGKLELIDNQIDTNSGTLRVKATFENKDYPLWPGQFVTARVLVETRKQALVVPTQVVQSGLDGPFVYLVTADKKVEARPVKPGPRAEGITVIEEGLNDGDQVVLDGQSKLQPGATIAIGNAKP